MLGELRTEVQKVGKLDLLEEAQRERELLALVDLEIGER